MQVQHYVNPLTEQQVLSLPDHLVLVFIGLQASQEIHLSPSLLESQFSFLVSKFNYLQKSSSPMQFFLLVFSYSLHNVLPLKYPFCIAASAATFSRFIPSVKARFDYGAMIFILTFSLVSVSGYRVDKLFNVAHQRFSTIIVGTTLCILISMLFYPIWAGDELHNLIHRNLEKLTDSLDGTCTANNRN